MHLIRHLPIALSVVLVAGCSSGPPQCSGSEALSTLNSRLEDESRIFALIATSALPLGKGILLKAPYSLILIEQKKYNEAFLAIEESVMALPDEGYGDIAKQVLVAARGSTFKLSNITTTSQDELRSSCSVTVDFIPGLLSSKQISEYLENNDNLLNNYLPAFDALRTMRVQREYDVYHTDDGRVVVELFDAQ